MARPAIAMLTTTTPVSPTENEKANEGAELNGCSGRQVVIMIPPPPPTVSSSRRLIVCVFHLLPRRLLLLLRQRRRPASHSGSQVDVAQIADQIGQLVATTTTEAEAEAHSTGSRGSSIYLQFIMALSDATAATQIVDSTTVKLPTSESVIDLLPLLGWHR